MICKLFLMQCVQAIADISSRAKEAVEKLTGDKVTAKRELCYNFSVVKEIC